MLTDAQCRLRALNARHDELNRESPSPTVLLAARIVLGLTQLCGSTMAAYSAATDTPSGIANDNRSAS